MENQNEVRVANPVDVKATFKVGGSIMMLVFAIMSTVSYAVLLISFSWINILSYILDAFLVAGLWCLWGTCKAKKQNAIGPKFINFNITFKFVLDVIVYVILILFAVAILAISVVGAGLISEEISGEASSTAMTISAILPIGLIIGVVIALVFSVLYFKSLKSSVLVAKDSLDNKPKVKKNSGVFAAVMIIIKSVINFGPTIALAFGSVAIQEILSQIDLQSMGSTINEIFTSVANAGTGAFVAGLIQFFADIILAVILIQYNKELAD